MEVIPSPFIFRKFSAPTIAYFTPLFYLPPEGPKYLGEHKCFVSISQTEASGKGQ